MKKYSEMSAAELAMEKERLEKKYEEFKARDLHLDITRGKPSARQLDISEAMLGIITKNSECLTEDGTDCRNYGLPSGLPQMREFMGKIAGAPAAQTVVCGNASLNIMFDTVSRGFTHGFAGCIPWGKLDKIKFLCPAPGYDRHFAVTEYFNVEMINVPMTPEGPDMDMVEELVSADELIKGIWCVPKYSNPQGITYSDETVRRFANLKPAARDFRIFWDNAYGLHHIYNEPEKQDKLLNIIEECERAGNPDHVFVFCSTSKITYAGAGISAIASSVNNIKEITGHIKYQTIGPDKMNQLRHINFLKDFDTLKNHMKKQADLVRPSFETVYEILHRELDGLGIADWTEPNGGYFICFEAQEGCAAAIVKTAKEAGLALTDAGSVYPYHKDPRDAYIRIAPTMPTLSELRTAVELFALCVKLVSANKLLAEAK